MATERDDPLYPEEDEGGPTKSFLDHLEDLRWTLMKCAAAVGIGFLVCILATPMLVKVLKWPLERSELNQLVKAPAVTLMLGTNRLGTFYVETNQTAQFLVGSNLHTTLNLVPVAMGTNQFLAIQVSTNSTDLMLPMGEQIQLRNFGPAAGFMIAFQISLYGGMVLASPFLFYFIAQFVFPALKTTEKRYVYPGIGVGLFLFILGVCFCYFILMPMALSASVKYSHWLGFRADEWRAEEYITFVCKFMLGMGLGFEMPVVILILVKIGIVNYRQLAAFRRYMIVINLILGAVLTTPEVLTQVAMFVPLQLLYEVSVWIAWYWERQERKRQEALERVS
jgi:sec-independent protein translocase protein TatC